MKIPLLTTVFAIILTLPAFGFSLGEILNLKKKPDEPRELNESASVSDSASESSSAAASESAIGGQQGISEVDIFLKGISGQTQSNSDGSKESRNPDSPSNAQATGGGCQKNDQGEIVC